MRARSRTQSGRRDRTRRPLSPSHPNYKEEAYLQTRVVLKYVGHPDHPEEEAGRRGRRRRKKKRRGSPYKVAEETMQIDEVTIVQQPRGSYVLEVFHGFLAVGGGCSMFQMACSKSVSGFFVLCRRVSVQFSEGRRVPLQSDHLRESAISCPTVRLLRVKEGRGFEAGKGLFPAGRYGRCRALSQVCFLRQENK